MPSKSKPKSKPKPRSPAVAPLPTRLMPPRAAKRPLPFRSPRSTASLSSLASTSSLSSALSSATSSVQPASTVQVASPPSRRPPADAQAPLFPSQLLGHLVPIPGGYWPPLPRHKPFLVDPKADLRLKREPMRRTLICNVRMNAVKDVASALATELIVADFDLDWALHLRTKGSDLYRGAFDAFNATIEPARKAAVEAWKLAGADPRSTPFSHRVPTWTRFGQLKSQPTLRRIATPCLIVDSFGKLLAARLETSIHPKHHLRSVRAARNLAFHKLNHANTTEGAVIGLDRRAGEDTPYFEEGVPTGFLDFAKAHMEKGRPHDPPERSANSTTSGKARRLFDRYWKESALRTAYLKEAVQHLDPITFRATDKALQGAKKASTSVSAALDADGNTYFLAERLLLNYLCEPHLDTFNDPAGLGVSIVDSPNMVGGDLVLPGLRLALDLSDGVAVFGRFALLHHGVTSISPANPSCAVERFSTAFYNQTSLFTHQAAHFALPGALDCGLTKANLDDRLRELKRPKAQRNKLQKLRRKAKRDQAAIQREMEALDEASTLTA